MMSSRSTKGAPSLSLRVLTRLPGLLCLIVPVVFAQIAAAPKIWDDSKLDDWATPLAALDARPSHYSAEEYYRIPPDNFRTYPVFLPNREPPGYWEWLQNQKPEPLVDADKMKGNEDWIAAGERAFREIDFVLARTNDPQMIAK